MLIVGLHNMEIAHMGIVSIIVCDIIMFLTLQPLACYLHIGHYLFIICLTIILFSLFFVQCGLKSQTEHSPRRENQKLSVGFRDKSLGFSS